MDELQPDYSAQHAFNQYYGEYLSELNYVRHWYLGLPLWLRLEVRPYLTAADNWYLDLLHVAVRGDQEQLRAAITGTP